MSTMPAYVLQTEGLTKIFEPPAGVRRLLMRSPITEPITALNDVSIEVRPGEVFGLLGPNGAGKTTLIKLLTTLLQPTRGFARVCGYDTVRQEMDVRRVIGTTIGEERSFYWRLSARQNLQFFGALAAVPKREMNQRIDEVLQLMGLEREADNMFYSFSSGMKQKLAIARSLLAEPRMLFLDEPTKNVDAVTGNELKRLVKEKLSGESGRSVLLATHRMEEAEQLCDRIAIIRSGRVIFCGTIPELRRQVGDAEECVLRVHGMEAPRCRVLAERHLLADLTVERPGNNGLVELRFSAAPDGIQLSQMLQDVLAGGATVLSVDRRERGLEEMFLDVVQGKGEKGNATKGEARAS